MHSPSHQLICAVLPSNQRSDICNEAILCHRHVLCGMCGAGGEGGQRCAGRDERLCQPADERHGRRRDGGGRRNYPRSAGCGLRRKHQGHGKQAERIRRRRSPRRPRNPEAQTPPVLVAGLPDGADVFLHGSHDVGLAAARVVRRQPRRHGADADAAHHHHHSHQPEVLYQRLQGAVAPQPEYGHARRAWRNGLLPVQHLCALCHDRRAAAREYGRRHGLHARVLL